MGIRIWGYRDVWVMTAPVAWTPANPESPLHRAKPTYPWGEAMTNNIGTGRNIADEHAAIQADWSYQE
jgi:hypothetical protein